uniref:Uncharacterized protein n=1 Tax=Nelumbo nucifera TaxID=4432 RepID=A0A822YBI5_NELNU|nr:TPA_asm: hypothetical protein HUJ06_029853 [Nelumbo nucifera]
MDSTWLISALPFLLLLLPCARQGFALGLTVVVDAIPSIRVESLMKLIVNLLEVSSSMKGQASAC